MGTTTVPKNSVSRKRITNNAESAAAAESAAERRKQRKAQEDLQRCTALDNNNFCNGINSSLAAKVSPWRRRIKADDPPGVEGGISCSNARRILPPALAVLTIICALSLLIQQCLLPNEDLLLSNEKEEEASPFEKKEKEDDQPEVLPLLPWEVECAVNRTCNPPSKDFPEHCCLGSVTKGGALFYNPRLCSDPSIYARVENYTLDFMEKKYNTTTARTQHDDNLRHNSGRLCDICQIVDHLINHNLTLTFQGDSMTRQTFSGLECELRRRGYGVRARTTPWAKRKDDTNWRYGIKAFSKLSVSLPPTNNIEKNSTQQEQQQQQYVNPLVYDAVARIQMYAIHRPLEDNLEILEIVDSSDILVFDHGLHWMPWEKDDYLRATTKLLQAYRNSKLKLLAWRETSAQHYNRTGGHWLPDAELESCVPMKEEEKEGWRLPLMSLASNRAGFRVHTVRGANFMHRAPSANSDKNNTIQGLFILPFREYTSELHYLHPGECAHYCSNPYVWLPVWRSLRLAMDRVLLQE